MEDNIKSDEKQKTDVKAEEKTKEKTGRNGKRKRTAASFMIEFFIKIGITAIVIAVLYVPSVIINYGGDKGMFSFVFIYLFMGICGLFTGNVLRRRQYNEKQPLGLNTALKMQRMREEKAKKDKVLKRKHTKKKHKKK